LIRAISYTWTWEKLTDAQHAIDVEATIRNGALDVGIFAPTEMMGLQDGEDLVRNLRRQLEEL
jgi:hypothetical protein